MVSPVHSYTMSSNSCSSPSVGRGVLSGSAIGTACHKAFDIAAPPSFNISTFNVTEAAYSFDAIIVLESASSSLDVF